jgi:dihydropteroate synthase
MKPGVAKAAIDAGASIVNDVAAARQDPTMWGLVATSGAAYICMHMQGSPATMQDRPAYQDVVEEVGQFFFDSIERLRGCGIPGERVILDPGIGFGKTFEHNLALLGALRQFSKLGCPLMIGVSRKSFLAKFGGESPQERLPAALACACAAVQAGVQIIRAHEVSETVQAVRAAHTLFSA